MSASRPLRKRFDDELFIPAIQRTTHRRAAAPRAMWSVVVIAAQRLFEQIAHRRVRPFERTSTRLVEFDDRQLADIGLNRDALLHLIRYGRLPSHSNQRR